MTIKLSVEEIFNRGIWDEFCELKRISVWAASEGQVQSDEIFVFTEYEAKKLGINLTRQ